MNTVKTNLKALYRKLQVSSRTAAVDRAVERGLIGGEPLPPAVAPPRTAPRRAAPHRGSADRGKRGRPTVAR